MRCRIVFALIKFHYFKQTLSDARKDVEKDLDRLKKMTAGPALLIEKRQDKLCDLNMYSEEDQSSEAMEARSQFKALHDQLMEDLPKLIHLGKQFVTLCTCQVDRHNGWENRVNQTCYPVNMYF